MSATMQQTRWHLRGTGYEFCSCQPGCTCNFSGFPSSSDGACKAMVGNHIVDGRCGDVDLSGVKAIAVVDWPHAIHDGGGRAVFIVDPAVSEEQVECLSQIYTGSLGGDPWAILGSTFEVVGLERAPISFEGEGIDQVMTAEGHGKAAGRSLRNPVTDETHEARIVLPDGFIWTEGNCGIGSFEVSAGGLSLAFTDTNWIGYDFDWSND